MTTVVAEATAVTSVSVDVAGTTAVTGGFVTAIPVILGVCGQQHTTTAVTAVVVITVPTEELVGVVAMTTVVKARFRSNLSQMRV